MFGSVSSLKQHRHQQRTHDKNTDDINQNSFPSSPISSSSFPDSQWYSNQSCDHLPPMSSTYTRPESPAVVRSRSATRSPIRLSVFGARSRSNTATSSSSSFKSPASSMTSVDTGSRRSSQDGRTPSSSISASEKEAVTTKSILSRGSRILRRKGSKFSISSNLTLDEEDEMARGAHSASQKTDALGIFYRSHRSRHSDTRSCSSLLSPLSPLFLLTCVYIHMNCWSFG